MSDRSAIGKANKKKGELFERLIDNSCRRLLQLGAAKIQKTPEPMRVIQPLGNGKFASVFTKKAQPDYKGCIRDGNCIVFDAKYTDGDKLRMSAFSEEQKKDYEEYMQMGARCYALVSVRFEHFYFVPWGSIEHMKDTCRREYMTVMEMEMYEVPVTDGCIDFLTEQGFPNWKGYT